MSDLTISPYTDLRALGAGVYLSEAEVATILRVSPGTLRNWRTAKTGPRVARVGKSPLYRAVDVADWLETTING